MRHKKITFRNKSKAKKTNKTKKNNKTNKNKKLKKLKIKQKGGTNLVSNSLLNVARYVPHTISNAYNGLVGNTATTSFLPWVGHYS